MANRCDPGAVKLFFRADDIGVPGRQCARLMAIFERHQAPLCLAVVPSWLTRRRWQTLKKLALQAPHLCCWHQHGWRHVNYEQQGKKQEFGPGRSAASLQSDLVKGQQRLHDLLGQVFYPVFTPPWNRCSRETLRLLSTLGYVAISRFENSRPVAPDHLPDLSVNVDLHTRKSNDPHQGWLDLERDFIRALASGLCGVMLHHQRMNTAAFSFLDLLIRECKRHPNIEMVHFRDLMASEGQVESGG
jgi:peptidoglycan/xylan/chitin deacetylase (PgdA/CDA1 family)